MCLSHAFTMNRFAKFMGFKNALSPDFRRVLRSLVDKKAIVVQQSGFKADSSHHEKLVIIRNSDTVEKARWISSPSDNTQEPETKEERKVVKSRKADLPETSLIWVSVKVGVTALMRASAKGGAGLYLYVPKDYADAYDIHSGDKVEAKIIRVLRQVPLNLEPGEIDLSRKGLENIGSKRKKVKAT